MRVKRPKTERADSDISFRATTPTSDLKNMTIVSEKRKLFRKTAPLDKASLMIDDDKDDHFERAEEILESESVSVSQENPLTKDDENIFERADELHETSQVEDTSQVRGSKPLWPSEGGDIIPTMEALPNPEESVVEEVIKAPKRDLVQ